MPRIVESLWDLYYWGATGTVLNETYTIVRRKAWGMAGKEEEKRRAGAVLSRATRGSTVHSLARQKKRAGQVHGTLSLRSDSTLLCVPSTLTLAIA